MIRRQSWRPCGRTSWSRRFNKKNAPDGWTRPAWRRAESCPAWHEINRAYQCLFSRSPCQRIIRHIGPNEALAARFMRALGKAGWFRTTNEQREEQHAVRFTAYHVKEGFPRLLKGPAYLPPGVILKSYKVDLGKCGKFQMDEPEFNAVVEALASPQ